MSLDIKSSSTNTGKSLNEFELLEFLKLDKKDNQMDLNQDLLSNQDENLVIRIGICAMNKKVISKPMQKILELLKTNDFEIIIFDEEIIFKKSIQDWPIVDCLISWFSEGFPLQKALQYSKLRSPFLINDLEKQNLLFDRTIIYKLLKKNNIRISKSYFVYRKQEQWIPEQSEDLRKVLNSIRFSDDDLINEEKKISNTEESQGNQLNIDSYNQKFIQPYTRAMQNNFKDCLQINNETQNQKKDRKFKRSKSTYIQEDDSMQKPLINEPQKEFKPTKVEEFEDYILIDGQKLLKPFVEKPFDAENHNIYIYYSQADGGGCKKLFRKVENKSSDYEKELNTIRQDQNMIYEVFLPTNGFDIKVYTVGPDYTHAEARKAPVLDGVVQRTDEGKEVRFPVILTPEEKFISQKIVKIFGQNICGFDLLRSNGKSYVCDVNGWSFVKGNAKYYKDCAIILKQMIYKRFAPKKLSEFNENLSQNILIDLKKNSYRPKNVEDICGNQQEELRSVVAIFRHADRTPKQKMKMKIQYKQIIKFYLQNTKDTPNKELKVKNAKLLQAILNISREIFEELQKQGQKLNLEEECCLSKIIQMISVLEQGGQFEGINRKIQIKPIEFQNSETDEYDDINKKENQLIPSQVLIILKWGGELTHSGEQQSEELGKFFRDYLYPAEKDGILRLHSTYRHDLKTYTSDEGRCQKTAGAFLKGFLQLEGEIAPIMASMLTKNEIAYSLLDQCNSVLSSDPLELQIKQDISNFCNSEENLYEAFQKKFGRFGINENMKNLMEKIRNPRKRLESIHEKIRKLTKGIFQMLNLSSKTYYVQPKDWNKEQNKSEPLETCGNESLILMYKRWRKLTVDLLQNNIYNISKVPDVYDNIKYDYLHNRSILLKIDPDISSLYEEAEMMSNFVVPNEFGMDEEERVDIAMKTVKSLCNKIKKDLVWWYEKNFDEEDFWKYQNVYGENNITSPWRHIRTRLYFASATQLYSLFNIVHLGLESRLIESQESQSELDGITSLQYLSHILFRLYENLHADTNDPERFRLELSVSPGCQHNPEINDDTHTTPVKPLISINKRLNIFQIKEFFTLLVSEQYPLIVKNNQKNILFNILESNKSANHA
ncbi:hypothetical protein ABPG72_013009 [Tetrahymena utriculariae]